MRVHPLHSHLCERLERKEKPFPIEPSKERQQLLETEVVTIFANQLGTLNFKYRSLRSLAILKTFLAMK